MISSSSETSSVLMEMHKAVLNVEASQSKIC